MPEVYIALGSNLDDPVRQLDQAVAALKALPKTHWHVVSPYYYSKPMGPDDQPDYVNAVARIDTRLTPLALLDRLQWIERRQGRVRKSVRWGPRTLDLDLLLYGRKRIRQRRLIVPHYDLAERDFVIIPLLDVANGDLNIPGIGLLSALKQKHKKSGLVKIVQHV
ncbi:MAG TPA: 2-amino-4-hydroxy-6-hydroxymethyldihydropteridine diphosphokinase [Chromatiales bacterium]|nr:2-amino-4-hydroxy-6-hydroxymethyldihydropteridine diphosphokinase [Thiotrichales bacterium]HIP68692.1 2-amino-4-hydroxy-6-hydroxymethyldihydropteridine diphosphokinase [Chromatiales bacterium]